MVKNDYTVSKNEQGQWIEHTTQESDVRGAPEWFIESIETKRIFKDTDGKVKQIEEKKEIHTSSERILAVKRAQAQTLLNHEQEAANLKRILDKNDEVFRTIEAQLKEEMKAKNPELFKDEA